MQAEKRSDAGRQMLRAAARQKADKKTMAQGFAAVERCMDRVMRDHAHDPLEGIIREHLDTGGKRLRARLALTAVLAMGYSLEDGAPLAAACEMLHNATLIHDDLQDGDTVRRGQPAVWARYGAAQAINAGDLLLMLPFLALEHAPYDEAIRWRLASCFARRSARTACGQSLEQSLMDNQLLTWDAYLLASSGKTGAFFAMPVEGAALVGKLSSTEAAAIGDAVLPLGVLFQVQDDVLDLYGDKGRGKVGNDIREGKVSALVVAHLELYPEDAPRILEVLRAPREATREEEVAALSSLFIEKGALDLVIQRARELHQRVTGSPSLRAVPKLHAIATEIADTIFLPLERAVVQPLPCATS